MPEQVFYVVDGKVVPKPGNQRGPGRRYAGIGNDPKTGEPQVREFTLAEEAERDAEEAKWKAEQPAREAAERDRQDKAKAYEASLKYERRLVGFLDVLGWREAIAASIHDPALVPILGLSLTALQNQAGLICWMQEHAGDAQEWPGDPQITHFSDCIVISTRPDFRGQSRLISTMTFLATAFLTRGFLLRGAVVIDQMYHRGAVAYGPALVRAYQMEQAARYPRIVLEDGLAAAWGNGHAYYRNDGSLLGHAKTWRRDKDGLTFLDILQPPGAATFEDPGLEFFIASMATVRALAEAGLEKFAQDRRVGEKYVWLASYFNDLCAEYPAAEIQPIDM